MPTVDNLPEVVRLVRRACADFKREPSTLQRGVDVRVVLSVEDFAWLAAANGLDHVPSSVELSRIVHAQLVSSIRAEREGRFQ